MKVDKSDWPTGVILHRHATDPRWRLDQLVMGNRCEAIKMFVVRIITSHTDQCPSETTPMGILSIYREV